MILPRGQIAAADLAPVLAQGRQDGSRDRVPDGQILIPQAPNEEPAGHQNGSKADGEGQKIALVHQQISQALFPFHGKTPPMGVCPEKRSLYAGRACRDRPVE